MWRSVRSTILAVGVLTAPVLAPDAEAQRRRAWPDRTWTFELFGGLANFGRFLEQYADVEIIEIIDDIDDFDVLFVGQRELTAGNSFIFGGSAAYRIWDKTHARLAFSYTASELEFEDDSGTDSGLLDDDDLADLGVFVLSLEVFRYVLDPARRWVPFVAAGVSGAWWHVDDDDEILSDGTEFRWGGTGSVGIEYRASRRWSVRAEVATMGLGNPFDGNESFRTDDGVTFDEPSTTRLSRITLGVTYALLRSR